MLLRVAARGRLQHRRYHYLQVRYPWAPLRAMVSPHSRLPQRLFHRAVAVAYFVVGSVAQLDPSLTSTQSGSLQTSQPCSVGTGDIHSVTAPNYGHLDSSDLLRPDCEGLEMKTSDWGQREENSTNINSERSADTIRVSSRLIGRNST